MTPDNANAQPVSESRERFERHGGRRRHSNPQRRQESGRTATTIGTSVNMDELREVVELIAQHGFTDFELEREGFRVRLRRGTANTEISASTVAAQPSQPLASSFAAPAVSTSAPSSPTISAPTSSAAPAPDADLHIITSPIVGTVLPCFVADFRTVRKNRKPDRT